MSACTPHREFLAALADGETELVPAATVQHVNSCADCTREIRTHQLLTSKLRQVAGHLEEGVPGRPLVPFLPARLRMIAAAAAATVLVAAAGAGWFVLSRPGPIQAAVTASAQPLQVQSTDPAEVGQWCFRASGRTLPAIRLDGMNVVGARMDRAGATDIVTVVYLSPSGARVTVSWLEGQAPAGSGVEDLNVSGRKLLVVHSTIGTAVVLASSSEAMWQTAMAIETSPS